MSNDKREKVKSGKGQSAAATETKKAKRAKQAKSASSRQAAEDAGGDVAQDESGDREPHQAAETELFASTDSLIPIVGIGTSAGGLKALRKFFEYVPQDTGFAYVIVTHLSPEHESHFAQLLQPTVGMPVTQVNDAIELKPNHVYVIPPNANLDTIDSHLRLTPLERIRNERAPVDHFFRTLAHTHRNKAAGVILTGTGSDGTLGVREIRQNGGFTVAQKPNEAEFDGMPQSAIAAGAVDLVLNLREIPDAVARFFSVEPQLSLSEEELESISSEQQFLHKVCTQLRLRTGRDFSRYKSATILRRIQRRMQLRQIEQLDNYLKLLREAPDEVPLLADELLVTVTSFFRDAEVYNVIEKQFIPQILAGKGASDTIRLWSVGCATGEEAYSLAILMQEATSGLDTAPLIHIFASDLHDRSLKFAREGFFPGDIETDVSPARLERFFTRENGGYRVRKELREMVVFAAHNLLSDPPFSRIDLILCRNVLIYVQRDAQRDIIELFHYALKHDGFLVLGTSETVDATDLFRTADKKSCVYQKRNVPPPEPRLPVFFSSRTAYPEVSRVQTPHDSVSYRTLHQQLVEHHSPPSILLSPENRVLHLSENAGQFLIHPAGELTSNVFHLLREELRAEVRALLAAVRRQKTALCSGPISLSSDFGTVLVVIHVRPSLEAEGDDFLLLSFEQCAAQHVEQQTPTTDVVVNQQIHDDDERLRAELQALQQRMQALTEEYETSQEEMRAANEEMQSTNEELRSTLEELETSKEELQSVNEELQTVNEENRHKVEELAQLSNDLLNLMAATHIATLFLDRQLRILRFTPQVADLFNVRTTDWGRPLSDITHKLGYEELSKDAKAVLKSLVPIEREVPGESGRWYLTRVLPYRSTDDRIEGVVITFVDISERKKAEQDLRASEARVAEELRGMKRLHTLVSSLIVSEDLESALQQVVEAASDITGAEMGVLHFYRPEREVLEIVAHTGFAEEYLEYFKSVEAAGGAACARALTKRARVVIADVQADEEDARHREIAQRAGYRAVQSTPLLSRSGELLGMLSTHYPEVHTPSENELRLLDLFARQAADFIERKRGDEHQEMLTAELNHRVKNSLALVLSVAEHTLRNSSSIDEFRQSFLGRVTALADVHRLLMNHEWCGVDLKLLVETLVRPYTQAKGPRLEIVGKALSVSSKAAQSFCLLIHELTSNAAKYGCLSVPDGAVRVQWEVADEEGIPVLHFCWSEHDGPKVEPPKHRSFGTRLIENTLSYELGGTTKLEFLEEGVRCSVSVALPPERAILSPGTWRSGAKASE